MKKNLGKIIMEKQEEKRRAKYGTKLFGYISKHLTNKYERDFYIKECTNLNWDVRTLKRQIKSCLYEKSQLSSKTNKQELLSLEGNILSTKEDIIKKDESETIKILLSATKNSEMVKLILTKNTSIYNSTYKLNIPSKEILIKMIEKEKKKLEQIKCKKK